MEMIEWAYNLDLFIVRPACEWIQLRRVQKTQTRPVLPPSPHLHQSPALFSHPSTLSFYISQVLTFLIPSQSAKTELDQQALAFHWRVGELGIIQSFKKESVLRLGDFLGVPGVCAFSIWVYTRGGWDFLLSGRASQLYNRYAGERLRCSALTRFLVLVSSFFLFFSFPDSDARLGNGGITVVGISAVQIPWCSTIC